MRRPFSMLRVRTFFTEIRHFGTGSCFLQNKKMQIRCLYDQVKTYKWALVVFKYLENTLIRFDLNARRVKQCKQSLFSNSEVL